MKLTDFLVETKLLSLNDLSATQVSMLKKLAKGGVDVDNITSSQEKVLDSLTNLKLVGSDYELTRMGKRMAGAADKFGSKDKRDAEEKAKKAGTSGKSIEKSEATHDDGPDESDDD